MTRDHFETDERRRSMMIRRNNLSLLDLVRKNENKSLGECFESLLDELACQKVKECGYACFKLAATFEAPCSDLRSSISTAERFSESTQTSPLSY
ncbi:putative glycosyl [Golovinomyces cichoracearum]|uniref:Putative glycosyl n=1 Tax=Golovinomyces cichoracearum TaxID=62708 RepID=A0A420H8M7_9PEZI|nr:putative glycosyl [Golovinomyces cichoracearum]